jgi:hypothetical protein
MNYEIDKLTMTRLKELPYGQEVQIHLPTVAALNSAKSMTYQMQHVLGCKFTVRTNYAGCNISITRHDL